MYIEMTACKAYRQNTSMQRDDACRSRGLYVFFNSAKQYGSPLHIFVIVGSAGDERVNKRDERVNKIIQQGYKYSSFFQSTENEYYALAFK